MNKIYEWSREEITEPGFYMALKTSEMDRHKLVSVVVYVTKARDGNFYAKQHTGVEHCSYSYPGRLMHEEYLLWAKLPDPM